MKNSWFTLVGLIIVVSILWILSVIGFFSLSWNTWDARDSVRKFDVDRASAILSMSEFERGALFEKAREVINIDNEVRCYAYHDTNFCVSKDEKTSYVFVDLFSPIALELQDDYRSKFINELDYLHKNAYIPRHLYSRTVWSGSFVINFERYLSKRDDGGIYIDISDKNVETLVKKLMLWKQIDSTQCYVLWFRETKSWYDVITSSSTCSENLKSTSPVTITYRKEHDSKTEFSSWIWSVYFDLDNLEYAKIQKDLDRADLNDKIAYIWLLLWIIWVSPLISQIILKKDINVKLVSRYPIVSYTLLVAILIVVALILLYA